MLQVKGDWWKELQEMISSNIKTKILFLHFWISTFCISVTSALSTFYDGKNFVEVWLYNFGYICISYILLSYTITSRAALIYYRFSFNYFFKLSNFSSLKFLSFLTKNYVNKNYLENILSFISSSFFESSSSFVCKQPEFSYYTNSSLSEGSTSFPNLNCSNKFGNARKSFSLSREAENSLEGEINKRKGVLEPEVSSAFGQGALDRGEGAWRERNRNEFFGIPNDNDIYYEVEGRSFIEKEGNLLGKDVKARENLGLSIAMNIVKYICDCKRRRNGENSLANSNRIVNKTAIHPTNHRQIYEKQLKERSLVPQEVSTLEEGAFAVENRNPLSLNKINHYYPSNDDLFGCSHGFESASCNNRDLNMLLKEVDEKKTSPNMEENEQILKDKMKETTTFDHIIFLSSIESCCLLLSSVITAICPFNFTSFEAIFILILSILIAWRYMIKSFNVLKFDAKYPPVLLYISIIQDACKYILMCLLIALPLSAILEIISFLFNFFIFEINFFIFLRIFTFPNYLLSSFSLQWTSRILFLSIASIWVMSLLEISCVLTVRFQDLANDRVLRSLVKYPNTKELSYEEECILARSIWKFASKIRLYFDKKKNKWKISDFNFLSENFILEEEKFVYSEKSTWGDNKVKEKCSAIFPLFSSFSSDFPPFYSSSISNCSSSTNNFLDSFFCFFKHPAEKNKNNQRKECLEMIKNARRILMHSRSKNNLIELYNESAIVVWDSLRDLLINMKKKKIDDKTNLIRKVTYNYEQKNYMFPNQEHISSNVHNINKINNVNSLSNYSNSSYINKSIVRNEISDNFSSPNSKFYYCPVRQKQVTQMRLYQEVVLDKMILSSVYLQGMVEWLCLANALDIYNRHIEVAVHSTISFILQLLEILVEICQVKSLLYVNPLIYSKSLYLEQVANLGLSRLRVYRHKIG